MRRKFYTKQDYQFIPKVGAKQPASVHSESVYKVRVPEQLRLEPWDYDFELPNIHGIQLDFVDPPGGVYEAMDMDEYDEREGEFVQGDQNVQPGDDVMDDAEGRGVRRRREEAGDADGGAQRVRRVNPAGQAYVNPMYDNDRRGQRRPRNQADLEADLIVRVGGRMGGAVRLPRANPPERAPPAPRTPGLAVEAARARRNSALRVARARRNLDFHQETQTVRNRNQMRYNPPAGLRAGLPPRKRPPEP